MLNELELKEFKVNSITRREIKDKENENKSFKIIISLKNKVDILNVNIHVSDNKEEKVYVFTENMGFHRFSLDEINELFIIMKYLENRKLNAELRTLLDE